MNKNLKRALLIPALLVAQSFVVTGCASTVSLAGNNNAVVHSAQATATSSLVANSTATTSQSQSKDALRSMIATIAGEMGIEPNTLLRMAQIESSLNADAINPRSGACGLFQFMPPTARQYRLKDCFDAEANVRAAAALLLDNKRMFIRVLGREPSPGEMYLMHQQGASGAIKLLQRTDQLAKDCVGAQAIIQNGGTLDMTCAEFAYLWTRKFDA